jgi:hypothetical protein
MVGKRLQNNSAVPQRTGNIRFLWLKDNFEEKTEAK